ncbi:hypothetical protein [Rhizobium rhizophilum]|uniref:PH domain-containing protein n=1 Tax=Rhizobium rhizophilum TaxID=1850373 RepID=A0ABY2R1F0_9HYPH|nr:hypothetical protein [Rhizobium rhizophilum]THV16681.1 hypothetical protein E9677_01350 [Rhizobium rhizophilum]
MAHEINSATSEVSLNIYDAIGTSTVRGFRQSSTKLLFHLVLYLSFIGGSIWLTWEFYVTDDARFLVVLACLAFFAVALVATIHRLLVLSGDVVILSPEGFHDLRLTAKLVPWNLIEDVSDWRLRGKSASTIILKLHGDAEDSLPLTLYGRSMRPYERLLGIQGIAVHTWTLDISHVRLLRLVHAYVAAAKKSDSA